MRANLPQLSGRLGRALEAASIHTRMARSWLASICRAGFGRYVLDTARPPRELLTLYDRESSPECRVVREALCHLDLDALVYPCLDDDSPHLTKVVEMGKRAEIPFLMDGEADMHLYGREEIVRHLYQRYGSTPWPRPLELLPGMLRASRLANLFVPGGEPDVRNTVMPARPLELWTDEWSPSGRLVRLELNQLEMPFVLHSAAIGSRTRRMLRAAHPTVEPPVLHDPNLGVLLDGLEPILEHLRERYEPKVQISATLREGERAG